MERGVHVSLWKVICTPLSSWYYVSHWYFFPAPLSNPCLLQEAEQWKTRQELSVNFDLNWTSNILLLLFSLLLQSTASLFLSWHLLVHTACSSVSQVKENTFNQLSEELRCVSNFCRNFPLWAHWSICAVVKCFVHAVSFFLCFNPGAQPVWGPPLLCGPAPEDCPRQGCGERLSALRLQQRRRLLQVRITTALQSYIRNINYIKNSLEQSATLQHTSWERGETRKHLKGGESLSLSEDILHSVVY